MKDIFNRIHYLLEDVWFTIKQYRKRTILIMIGVLLMIIGITLMRPSPTLNPSNDTATSLTIDEGLAQREEKRANSLGIEGIYVNKYIKESGLRGDGLYILYDPDTSINPQELDTLLESLEVKIPIHVYRKDLEQESYVYYPYVLKEYGQRSGYEWLQVSDLPEVVVIYKSLIISKVDTLKELTVDKLKQMIDLKGGTP